ncbi:MAG: hypothetical protein AB1714_10390 [Acidobacteriota bacterium]
MRTFRQRRQERGYHSVQLWIPDALWQRIHQEAARHHTSIQQALVAILRTWASREQLPVSQMVRNKRLYQQAFWKHFRGTWEEQCVFRIPPEEREKRIITDTSDWDEHWP